MAPFMRVMLRKRLREIATELGHYLRAPSS
jgi:hypothetical protein